jgi:hypothetical protein
MSVAKVVPVVVSQKTGEPDMLAAFVIAERAEKSKIEGWAQSFDFDLSSPVLVDLGKQNDAAELVKQLMAEVVKCNGAGVVAASTEYLRRAGIYSELVKTFAGANKKIWIADQGSLPLGELISA